LLLTWWFFGFTNILDAQNFMIHFYENLMILYENLFDKKSVQVPPAPTTSVLASVADIPLSPGVLFILLAALFFSLL
jgi:hypothetical protein